MNILAFRVLIPAKKETYTAVKGNYVVPFSRWNRFSKAELKDLYSLVKESPLNNSVYTDKETIGYIETFLNELYIEIHNKPSETNKGENSSSDSRWVNFTYDELRTMGWAIRARRSTIRDNKTKKSIDAFLNEMEDRIAILISQGAKSDMEDEIQVI